VAEERKVAFAFEAGGDVGPVEGILAALDDARSRATFFLDGRWADLHADIVRDLAAAGHELANHGYAHPDWTLLTDAEIEADLLATERLVDTLVGGSAKPWARPPFGAIDERVLAVLERNGYTPFYRDAVDGAHWPGETTTETVVQRALASAARESVVVFHTNRHETEAALPMILGALARDGRRVVPLTTLGATFAPRLARHPDFAGLTVNPGYVCPTRPGGRWHSLNVLELGTAQVRDAPSREWLADVDGRALELLVGSGEEVWNEPAVNDDRRVLVLAGALRCHLAGDGEPFGYLVARAGDLFLWPAGTVGRLVSADDPPRRWVAVSVRGASALSG